MDAHGFVDRLLADPDLAPSVVHVETLPARAPVIHPFPEALPELLCERLALQGIEGLYPHQKEGLTSVLEGRHTIVATGTASGKTLVYTLATATAMLEDDRATGLYLFPTKALARDQLRQVRGLKLPQIRAAVYDGDTPREERQLIRRNANLVLTNPDMLHRAFLPDHARWADFFLRLRYVVLDEAHTARGVFGSHVALILRRLRRLIAHYGGDPTFVMASATVGNPAELAERLSGLPFTAVTDDGSPAGEKLFVLWNPPVTDEVTGVRRSALGDAGELIADLVEADVRTIGFSRSRRGAELLADIARRRLPAGVRDRVKAYRAGYLADDRRALERSLSSGDLMAVCSTTALELGIDIGSLDAAVVAGYPGTRASMWQQVGRAGRAREDALAVLVANDDPLDQYLVAHHEDLFDQPPEDAVVDPSNRFVVEPHLRCAAREHPLRRDELDTYFAPSGAAVAQRLVDDGVLVERGELLHLPGVGSPHADVDIRCAGSTVISIVMAGTGELLGTVDEARAMSQVHTGAMYLHQGEQYEVQELSLPSKAALVTPSDAPFYTQVRDIGDLGIVSVAEEGAVGDAPLFFGTVRVTTQVTGFVRKRIGTGEVLGTETLDMPAQSLETTAVWWTVPVKILGRAALTPSQVPGAAHAAEHAAIGLLPLIATCDRWDVGGISTKLHPETGECTIFVYDGYPGGAGISERGFLAAERWLRATLETVGNCACSTGCPACVVSPKCGNGNEPLDKPGAVALLRAVLGQAWG